MAESLRSLFERAALGLAGGVPSNVPSFAEVGAGMERDAGYDFTGSGLAEGEMARVGAGEEPASWGNLVFVLSELTAYYYVHDFLPDEQVPRWLLAGLILARACERGEHDWEFQVRRTCALLGRIARVLDSDILEELVVALVPRTQAAEPCVKPACAPTRDS